MKFCQGCRVFPSEDWQAPLTHTLKPLRSKYRYLKYRKVASISHFWYHNLAHVPGIKPTTLEPNLVRRPDVQDNSLLEDKLLSPAFWSMMSSIGGTVNTQIKEKCATRRNSPNSVSKPPRSSHSYWPAQRTVATSLHSDWPQPLQGGLGCIASLASFYCRTLRLPLPTKARWISLLFCLDNTKALKQIAGAGARGGPMLPSLLFAEKYSPPITRLS